MPRHANGIEAAGSPLQDRAIAVEVDDKLIVAVADGAGGIGGSERAAELVVWMVEALARRSGWNPIDEQTWRDFLSTLDASIAQNDGGQTTAVVLAAAPGWICGASVGDSEAWLIADGQLVDLTADQWRYPFLGSGLARPVSFHHKHGGGTLVVGTDGLFKYAPVPRIIEVASGPPELACRALIDLVRMPNGKLQDDIGVVVCDLTRPE
jgi:serine/threonine protein phosphatase PrpC